MSDGQRSKQRTREMIPCEGLCPDGEETRMDTAIDVVAGHVVTPSPGSESRVVVAGADGRMPEIQHWCPDCSESRFGIGRSVGERPTPSTPYYLTARTAAAFALGVVLTLVACSMFIV